MVMRVIAAVLVARIVPFDVMPVVRPEMSVRTTEQLVDGFFQPFLQHGKNLPFARRQAGVYFFIRSKNAAVSPRPAKNSVHLATYSPVAHCAMIGTSPGRSSSEPMLGVSGTPSNTA